MPTTCTRRHAGKRLFAVIAFGASTGAVAGAWLSGQLIDVIGVHALLLAAAGGPGGEPGRCSTRSTDTTARRHAGRAADDAAKQPIGGRGAFALVAGNRYLLGMALVILLLNWVNSTGEYVLSSIVKQAAEGEIAAGLLAPADQGRYIGAFFAEYFQVVNIIGLVLQLFVVSRLVKWLGVPVALCVLPVVALGSYAVGGAAAVAGHRALGQDGRELGRLLADEHGAADAVPADHARGEVQGQAGDRQPGRALGRRAGRRHGLPGHHGASRWACRSSPRSTCVLVLVWLAASVLTGLEFRPPHGNLREQGSRVTSMRRRCSRLSARRRQAAAPSLRILAGLLAGVWRWGCSSARARRCCNRWPTCTSAACR